MWDEILAQLSARLGGSVELLESRQLYGGDINYSHHISTNKSDFFVKINQLDLLSMFEAEAENLKALANTGCVQVPAVVLCGQTSAYAFLVLSYHAMSSLSEFCSYQLGEQLAKLHQWGDGMLYGFYRDNYIGRLPQINTQQSSWAEFFTEQRLGYQLKRLQSTGVELIDIERFVDLIKEKLYHHQPKPSLLHGDLWAGNASQSNNQPIIYDPASYFGDRECDLAMTELFGGFSRDFHDGYQAVYPLDSGYEKRKAIYNLYHVLNHANHFGGAYIAQAEKIITSLLHCL